MATQSKTLKLGILALLVVAAAPVSSRAGWLGFRNDVKDSIVAGEVAWESVLLPGNRLIRIYDSKKVLIYQKTIPVMGDLFFSIQIDPKTNNVQLIPIKAPVQPPGQK